MTEHTPEDRRAALARIEDRRAALLLELEELEAMQEGHRLALTDRPRLARVDALPFEQVRLTLESGQAVTLDLEALPAAMLCPLHLAVGCCPRLSRQLTRAQNGLQPGYPRTPPLPA